MTGNKKKKAQPKNGYYFLMLDFKERNAAQGRHYSMTECAKLVQDEWTNMSQGDKNRYNEIAAGHKEQIVKYNTHGTSLAVAEAELLEKERLRRRMNEEIESMVKYLDPATTLQTKLFYLIHINYFYQPDQYNHYIPAEIGLAEFSLKDGITKTFHRFVKPGELPKGYRYAATEHCNRTHRIPLDLRKGDEELQVAERNWYDLLRDIKTFIKPGGSGELPPVYTMPDNENTNTSESAVVSVLISLCDTCNEDINIFKVYSLPKLFMELVNRASEDVDSQFCYVTMAENELEKDIYNYCQNIACTFHEEEDVVQYCSLAIVKRWVFLICEYCCHRVGASLVPGKHCPDEADTDQEYKQNLQAAMSMASQSQHRIFRPAAAPVMERSSSRSSGDRPASSSSRFADNSRLREPRSSAMSSCSSYKETGDSDTCSVFSQRSIDTSSERAVGGCTESSAGGVEDELSYISGSGRGMGRGVAWSMVASTGSNEPAPPARNDTNFPEIGAPSARPANPNPWGGRGRGATRGRVVANFKNLHIQ